MEITIMNKVLVMMIFITVAFSTNTFAQSIAEKEYRQGESLFNQGEDAKAFKLLKSSAGRGYGPAMNAIGYCFQYGKGVSKNSRYALQYYMNASVQGNLEGTYNYGWMHLRGDCKRDKTLAKKYLKMASDGGHAKAKEILRQEGWLETEKKQTNYIPQKKEPISSSKKNKSTTSYTYETDTRKKDNYIPIGNSWYTGSWDSSINNLIDHPKTVALRIEVHDSNTRLPIKNAHVKFRGNFTLEGRSSRHSKGEQRSQEQEFELSVRTSTDGIAISALDWRKEYPWKPGVDGIEKVQWIEVIHKRYRFVEQEAPFFEFLSVEEGRFEEFKNAWGGECSKRDVMFCTPRFNNFSQSKLFEKIHRKDWGIIYKEPINRMQWKDKNQQLYGPYLIYNIRIYMDKLNRVEQ
jgi:hypothetical protein